MDIQTRDFGQVTIEAEDIVTFVQPIYGFEDMSRYVFLYEHAECSQFAWLQSVDDKDICFILINPMVVVGDYDPAISKKDLAMIGDGENMLWLIAVVDEDFSKSTVNLKSPVVLNPVERKAIQVILDENYPIRYPLVQKGKGTL